MLANLQFGRSIGSEVRFVAERARNRQPRKLADEEVGRVLEEITVGELKRVDSATSSVLEQPLMDVERDVWAQEARHVQSRIPELECPISRARVISRLLRKRQRNRSLQQIAA